MGWRTMLVVPELEREVELLWELRDTCKVIKQSSAAFEYIPVEMLLITQCVLRFDGVNVDNEEELLAEIYKLKYRSEQVRLSHQQAQRECHRTVRDSSKNSSSTIGA
ncbi:HAD-superfamily hydrolase [Forsythia ovata]|uniref:HAD-superfamily hydrolase n=1 Tax=Forsythia ovata TaxID=205694 RepID=A0ABD1VPP1_9LAMI